MLKQFQFQSIDKCHSNQVVESFPLYIGDPDIRQNMENKSIGCGQTIDIESIPFDPEDLHLVEEEITGEWEKWDFDWYFGKKDHMHSLMVGFQHWTYNHTHGQIIITNLKGVAPLLSNPGITDLNPKYVSPTQLFCAKSPTDMHFMF